MRRLNPIRKLTWIVGCAFDTYRNRGYYHSRSDLWKIFKLRISAGSLGSRVIEGGDYFIGVKSFDQKIVLRKGTLDIFSLKEIIEWREYECVLEFGLPEDANIVDLGGNIGLASLYFASSFRRSRIVVVEPDPDNLRVLEANCRMLIDGGRMSVVRGFVADSDGRAEIDRSRGTLGTRMVGPGPGNAIADHEAMELVDCVSFPSLLRRHPMTRIDLLKCDIEGAERDLFRDCRAWIGRVENLIVETHLPLCSPIQLYDALRSNGWDFDLVSEDREGDRCTSGLRRRPTVARPTPFPPGRLPLHADGDRADEESRR